MLDDLQILIRGSKYAEALKLCFDQKLNFNFIKIA